MFKRLGRATQEGKAIITGDFELKSKVKGVKVKVRISTHKWCEQCEQTAIFFLTDMFTFLKSRWN